MAKIGVAARYSPANMHIIFMLLGCEEYYKNWRTEDVVVELTLKGENHAHVRLGGDLVFGAVGNLENALDVAYEKGCCFIDLDMANVHYVGNNGLGTLIRFHRKLKAVNGKLLFKNVQQELMDLFKGICVLEDFSIE